MSFWLGLFRFDIHLSLLESNKRSVLTPFQIYNVQHFFPDRRTIHIKRSAFPGASFTLQIFYHRDIVSSFAGIAGDSHVYGLAFASEHQLLAFLGMNVRLALLDAVQIDDTS